MTDINDVPIADDEDIVRLNIAIRKDALDILDKMKDKGRFGSRGRTIESLVEAVSQIGQDINSMSQLYNNQKSKDDGSAQLAFVYSLIDISRLLDRFVPTEIPSVAQTPQNPNLSSKVL